MSEAIKLELGCQYRTRGGWKARVSHRASGSDYKVDHETPNGHDWWYHYDDGSRSGLGPSDFDIVSLWEDAKGESKFVVGSQWRTRGGWRSVIVAVSDSKLPLTVWHENEGRSYLHLGDGKAGCCINEHDLMQPWTEPKRVRIKAFMNVFENGNVACFSDRQEADDYALRRIACVEIDREVIAGEGIETPAGA